MADDSLTPKPAAGPSTGVQPPQAPPSSVQPADATIKPLPPPRPAPSPEQAIARQRFLDGLIVAVVLAFAFLSSLFPAHNSDFFLHAAAGRLIAHGDFRPMIGVDPFAFTSQGYWVNTNWLYDLIVYLFYDTSAVGGTILIVLKALMVAALAEVMLRTARRPGRAVWLPACCVCLAVLTLSPRVLLQPLCVSFFFLGLTYWLLHLPQQKRAALTPALREKARAKRAANAEPPAKGAFLPYWLIPPLCLLWVNLDSWFFLGPITVALFLVGEALQGQLAAGERRTLFLVLLASLAACLVNPFHIWAFSPPSALGLSEASAALIGDEQFRGLFYSPFENYYFHPQTGLTVAGLAFYPLALLGLISFATAQWVGSWSWQRALVWSAFLALAVWRAGAVPFFAVVAGPIASLNFLDFADRRRAAAPAATGRSASWAVGGRAVMYLLAGVLLLAAAALGAAGWWLDGLRALLLLALLLTLVAAVLILAGRAESWAVGGRILTLLVGVALLVAAWPGWLQALQPAPWQWRRVGWVVEPDPSMLRLSDRIKKWQADSGMKHGVRWFSDSPLVLPYLAWYCPGELGCIDSQRLPLYDHMAHDFKQVRDSLAVKDGDAGKPDPRWRKLLRSFDAHFMICYEPNPLQRAASGASPLPTMLQTPEEWPMLYTNGPTSVFGWRDLAREEPPLILGARTAGLMAAPTVQCPLLGAPGLIGTPFIGAPFVRYEVSAEREAFGLGAVPVPPPADPTTPTWWSALWTPEAPRPTDVDEAAVQLQRFVGVQPRWYGQIENQWTDSWVTTKRLLQADAAGVCLGSGCSWAGPFETAALGRRLALLEDSLPPFPTSPDQPYYSWLHRQLDFGPAAPLYLCIRAARRALTVKADDPQPYLFLAQAYVYLLYQTREGDHASMVGYPPAGVPFPLLLRQVQIKTALRRMLDLEPNNRLAVNLSADLYRQTGFLELALHYAQEDLRIQEQAGANVTEVRKGVEALQKQIQQKQDTYLLKTANKRPTEKVQTALQMGLGQTALDELLKVDWNAFDDKDPNKRFLELEELNLMMQTGQVNDVIKELKDDEDKLRKGLGYDPSVSLPAYEWLRVEAAAARGDYADADHWLEEIEKIMNNEVPLLGLLPDFGVVSPDGTGLHDPDTRSMTSLLAANLILRQAVSASSPVWLPVPYCEDMRYLGLLGAADAPIEEPLSRAADMEAVRGWLAMEAGNIEAAGQHFVKAQEIAPVGSFRARPLAELCREWLNSGK